MKSEWFVFQMVARVTINVQAYLHAGTVQLWILAKAYCFGLIQKTW
jgi:hypothetical protein